MPRGDRYRIPPYTKGPRRTLAPMNADIQILQDVADRVADLEQEDNDSGYGLQDIELDVNGVISIGKYLGTPPVAETDTLSES